MPFKANMLEAIDFSNKFVDFLFSALWVIIIIALGLVLSKIVRGLVSKTLNIRKAAGTNISEKRAQTLQSIISSTIKYVFYFLIVYAVAGVVVKGATNPFIAVAGAVGVAIGLGAQDLIKDVIGGFFIIFEDLFSIGDIVEISGKMGTVEEIGLRSTKLRGFSGELYIMPNGSILTITNWSKGQSKAIVNIPVNYGEDIGRIIDILEDEMLSAQSKIADLTEKPAILGITEMNDKNIGLRITANCKTHTNWSVERELRLLILKRFSKENISAPYPAGGVTIKRREDTQL